MSSEIWAIVSAAAWAADSILVRKGTAFSNPSTAALISFSVNAAVLVPYIIYQYPAEKIFQSANLFFVLSGIIQPAIVRVMVLRRHRPARRFPRRTDPGNFAVFFRGDCLFCVSRTTGADRLFGRASNDRRHVVGVIQTGGRSKVARHRSFVSLGGGDVSVGFAEYPESRA